MQGITRPCRHNLDPALKQRWMSHLCGICLTLRDEAGQAARALTGYDVLMLSVLVEAQAGTVQTRTAAPCPLRGMRTTPVIPAHDPGARLAAAGSLLAGAAALEDKVRDRDVPAWAAPLGSRVATAAADTGRRLAAESGLDGAVLTSAALDAAAVETSGGTLEELLAPSGRAVAELFAQTAPVAKKPHNWAPLWQVGDAFGRLVHLLDAVDDHAVDHRRGRFNPLAATGTAPPAARAMAEDLLRRIHEGLAGVDMVDPDLAMALLGPVLAHSVRRHFPGAHKDGSCTRRDPGAGRATGRGKVPAASAAAAAATAMLAAPAVLLGIFGGGRRRPPRGYYDPYGPPPGYGYGYRRRGPSCCDMLACDCCANMACSDCCGGDDCCVCCC